MEIQEIWRIVRQRWRVIVITTLFCVSVALAWSLTAPVEYKAQGRMMIATYGSLSTAVDAYSGERVSQLRAPTYAQLIQGPEVAARTAATLGDRFTPEQVQDSLDARISAAMPMLVVSATAPTGDDAVRILATAEQVFKQYIAQIEEAGRDGSLTGVRLTNDPPTVSRVGNPARDATLAGLGGLVLGMMLALYRDRMGHVIRHSGQIARTGSPYRGTIVVKSGDARDARDAFRKLAVDSLTIDSPSAATKILITGVDGVSEAASPIVAMGVAEGLASYGRSVSVASAFPADDQPEWFNDKGWSAEHLGLSDVIAGDASWLDCSIPSPINHVFQIGAGRRGGDIDALLVSRSRESTADLMTSPSDHTVMMGPPLAQSPISVAVASTADCCLLVVTLRESSVSELVESMLTLDAMGVRLLGVVAVSERHPRPTRRLRWDWRPQPRPKDHSFTAVSSTAVADSKVSVS